LTMNSVGSIEELSTVTFQTIHDILGFDYGSLAIIEGENLVHRYHFGWNTEIVSMPLNGQGITVNAAVTGESQLVNDVKLDPDYIYSTQEERARTINSELAVPVKTRGTVLAVINIESKTDHAFSEKHQVLLEILAHHISSAIERIRTQEQESTRKQRQFDSILENIERHSRGVRHDLRSPLQSITNATYLMMKRPEQAKTYYQMVADSMSYCNEILADLWTNVKTSNLSLGKIEFNQLLDLSLVGVSGLERVQVIRDNVSNVTLTLDKAKIRRVLHNLLQNAVDAMPDSGVITVTNDVSPSGLEIIVQDTGQGIKKQVMTEIFTPFFTTKPNGMGLGLNLCKQVVEAHGGSIRLESEEGKGCRAHVHLPTSTVDNSSTSLPIIEYPKTN
ncbi:MAG: ATP-binding protein, partial [Candidatus Bathyarchaeota archaeon]|nr:ATP-binding protein [Candidatus Bathyarchaeota archaeon]